MSRSRHGKYARARLLAFVTAFISGVAICVNSHAVTHFGDATVVHDREECRRRPGASRVRAVPRRATTSAPRMSAPKRRWPGSARGRADRRQCSVRPLLRGARACRSDTGSVHPEDARRLGRAAGRAAPARAARHGACARDRVPHRRSGSLAGDAGTVVFGTGEAMILAATSLWAVEVIVAKRLLDGTSSRRSQRRGWASARSCSSHGSRSRAGWTTLTARRGAVALGAADRPAARRSTSRPGTPRSRARRPFDVTAVLVFGAVVTALLCARGRRRSPSTSVGDAARRRWAPGALAVAALRPAARRAGTHDRRQGRCSSPGTRTRRTRSGCAAPTSRAPCSSTATRARPTTAWPSSRAPSRARGRT